MLRPSLDTGTAKTIGCSIIMSRLDYCNSLLAFTSKQNIHRLQMVQNQLTRVMSGSGFRQSAAPILLSFHWLSVQRRSDYKIVNMVFKSRMNFLPEYLYRDLTVYTSVRPVRSSLQIAYVLQWVRLEVAKQSFIYSGAKLWNNLPSVLRSTVSYLVSTTNFGIFSLHEPHSHCRWFWTTNRKYNNIYFERFCSLQNWSPLWAQTYIVLALSWSCWS